MSIKASSAGLGWSMSFASLQREEPFRGRQVSHSDALLVTGNHGPVDVTYRIGGRSVSKHLHQKGVFFLPPGRDCEVTLRTPLDTLHVHLHPDLFRSPEPCASGQDVDLRPILGDPEGVTCSLLAVLEEILLQGDTSCSLLADSVALAIANRLLVLNRLDRKPENPSGRALGSRHVRAVRDFVENHLADSIPLTELAKLCGVSCEHFVRTFKTAVGVSPHRYVLGLRINHAKRLLRDYDQGLAQIARQCGFAHQQHFTNTFRRMTGVTPGAYRRSLN
ncbi:helix-turn-helix domain-containing protein [Bradyrhizobium sp. USDA 4369]